MSLTFYAKRECPFCWQVKIALEYLEIEYDFFETEHVDKKLVAKHSPQGTLPVIHDDKRGLSVWDSVAIILYLEDYAKSLTSDPVNTLLPGEFNARQRARQLALYSNQIAGKGLREIIFEKREKSKSDWDLRLIEESRRAWNDKKDYLEARVEQQNSFLREGVSWADAALIPRFILAEKYGEAVDSNHPLLSSWFASAKELPSVKTILFTE